jgi:hypothetical protein
VERRPRQTSHRGLRPHDHRNRSARFVLPEDRIATFDQDGTLWVEHPVYSQLIYCLDRVPVPAKEKPELKNVEPFKTVLSGDLEAIAKPPLPELLKIVAATLDFLSAGPGKHAAFLWDFTYLCWNLTRRIAFGRIAGRGNTTALKAGVAPRNGQYWEQGAIKD